MADPALKPVQSHYSIVAVDKFIQATRDSGYKSTVSAISELVDNSVQAKARVIDISVTRVADDVPFPIRVSIRDDGCGMDPGLLRTAMRFGGSSRFGDRSGLGRYGMGLPNSSLSQSRRVDVYSWRPGGPAYRTFLDVDRIASGEITEVPEPIVSNLPVAAETTESGTVVFWTECDRLDNKRVSTLVRKLRRGLGRKFRYFLWQGGEIRVNDTSIEPIDPLFLHHDSAQSGAHPFGEPLVYEFQVEENGELKSGFIRVTFSELPVGEWHNLPNDEKRRLGIAKGAGVSVVRGGREVDYGWFLMGTKRRENYDDWWRCEICFEPVLDELFGITHTKQQILPSEVLHSELSPDLEQIARVLNQRARAAHQKAKTAPKPTPSETRASNTERDLPPLKSPTKPPSAPLMRELERQDPGLRKPPGQPSGTEYRIVEARQKETAFFSVVHQEGRLVVVINPDHQFYRQVYKPLLDSEQKRDKDLLTNVELLLLSAARAEASLAEEVGPAALHLRREWSDVLAAFLGN